MERKEERLYQEAAWRKNRRKVRREVKKRAQQSVVNLTTKVTGQSNSSEEGGRNAIQEGQGRDEATSQAQATAAASAVSAITARIPSRDQVDIRPQLLRPLSLLRLTAIGCHLTSEVRCLFDMPLLGRVCVYTFELSYWVGRVF
jgi:hypothetical protein